MRDLKNLKTFKGNKDGSDWDLKPVDKNNLSAGDIKKLSPDQVNIIIKIRPENRTDPKTGKRLFVKRVKLCRVSDLPDYKKTESIEGDNQREYISKAIASFKKIKAIANPGIKTEYGTTVGNLMDKYLDECGRRGEKNLRDKKSQLQVIRNIKTMENNLIGDIQLLKIMPDDLWSVRNYMLQKELTGKTVNNYLSTLRGCFEYAKNNFSGFAVYAQKNCGMPNPAKLLSKEKVVRSVHRELSDEERDNLMKCLAIRTSNKKDVNKWHKNRSKVLFDFVTFGIWIGCRKGEAQALHWNNIDLQKNEITFTHTMRNGVLISSEWVDGELIQKFENNVRTKGLKNGMPERTIPFGKLPDIREMLLRRWAERKDEWVFGKEDCRTSWENLLEFAGIENFKFHSLRHTVGSYLFQEGLTLDDIAFWLGHDSTVSTSIYARKDKKTGEKCNDALVARMG